MTYLTKKMIMYNNEREKSFLMSLVANCNCCIATLKVKILAYLSRISSFGTVMKLVELAWIMKNKSDTHMQTFMSQYLPQTLMYYTEANFMVWFCQLYHFLTVINARILVTYGMVILQAQPHHWRQLLERVLQIINSET